MGIRLFSYVVTHDSGFAPNPFHKVLTLACCKPRVRSSADRGDWVIGTLSTVRFPGKGKYILYAMKVTQKMTFEKYWKAPEFAKKKPNMKGSPETQRGDNIYDYSAGAPLPIQLHSQHSNADGSEDDYFKKHDLGGKDVLISSDFIYFGKSAKPLGDLDRLRKKGPGHKSNFTEGDIKDLEMWLCENGYIAGKGVKVADPNDFERPRSYCQSVLRDTVAEDGTEYDDE